MVSKVNKTYFFPNCNLPKNASIWNTEIAETNFLKQSAVFYVKQEWKEIEQIFFLKKLFFS